MLQRTEYEMSMLGTIPHQKFRFYHLPTRGRAGIKLGDAWYVSNVSIIFYCSMLLYDHSWMFYNHFIVILYHFLVLTYWHGAKCQLLFFCMFFTSQKVNTKRSPNAVKLLWIFLDQKTSSGPKKHLGGCSEGSTTHQGALGGPGAPRWVVPTSVASRTASLLYEYPNIP